MIIEYHGRRPRHDDRLYGTGEWTPGLVKDVPDVSGQKLLRHPDMFKAGTGEAAQVIAKEVVAEAAKNFEERRVQDARDTVQAMQDKQAVLDFALANYQRKLDSRLRLGELKRQAVMLIDQYGLP